MRITDNVSGGWSVEAILKDGAIYFTEDQLLELDRCWGNDPCHADFILPIENGNGYILKTDFPRAYIIYQVEGILKDQIVYQFPCEWTWTEVKEEQK